MAERERLGKVSEAAERLGTDAAGVFDAMARGEVELERESDDEPWTVWLVR